MYWSVFPRIRIEYVNDKVVKCRFYVRHMWKRLKTLEKRPYFVNLVGKQIETMSIKRLKIASDCGWCSKKVFRNLKKLKIHDFNLFTRLLEKVSPSIDRDIVILSFISTWIFYIGYLTCLAKVIAAILNLKSSLRVRWYWTDKLAL